jgi:hypothetical protein
VLGFLIGTKIDKGCYRCTLGRKKKNAFQVYPTHGSPMLQEEFGATEQSVSSRLASTVVGCDDITGEAGPPLPQCELKPLADELIGRRCGSHSLGLVYWFLRNAGMEDHEARAEFEQFLSGTLSNRVLDIAAGWIKAERGNE